DEMPHRVRVAVEKLTPRIDPSHPEAYKFAFTPDVLGPMRDTMLAHVITAWSFGEPPGGNPEALGVVPETAYDRLLDETGEHWTKLGFTSRKPAEKKEKS